MRGASDTETKDHARRLRDSCAVVEPPKLFVGDSRGSARQACGNVIKPGEREYDIVAGMLELRLDQACYKLFLANETLTPAGELAFQAWLRADPIKAFKHVFSSAGGAIGFRWSHGSKIAHPHGDHSRCAVQCRNQRDAKTRGD
jgi:hypothetical protein